MERFADKSAAIFSAPNAFKNMSAQLLDDETTPLSLGDLVTKRDGSDAPVGNSGSSERDIFCGNSSVRRTSRFSNGFPGALLTSDAYRE